MGKTLGSWSGMRKYLETEMLAGCLRGRVRYNCTAYAGMDGCHIFEIFLDGRLIKQFSWETVNSYFIAHGLTENREPFGIGEYWAEFWTLLAQIPKDRRAAHTDGEFSRALTAYRNQKIEDSLASDDPLVRMFAILDRRVGRRTLEKLKDTITNQPDWLRPFYILRFEAENI